MKKVTCPNCGNYGSPPTMEESAKAFGLEEDRNIGSFRMRGKIEGRPIWVCNKCDSGLWIKIFGRPKLIIGETLQSLKDEWESGTGRDF